MFSKRSLEGELLIDNRPSGHGMTENATITCNHCQTIVVLNPGRIRDRHYCQGCDKYICDECELRRKTTGKCRTFNQFADEYLNNIVHNRSNEQLIKEFLNG